MAMILPALRADCRAVRSYRYAPGPPLTCPVTVLTGAADPMVPAGAADGWREHTTGPFARHSFPGDHFYLVEQQAAVTGVVSGQLGGQPA